MRLFYEEVCYVPTSFKEKTWHLFHNSCLQLVRIFFFLSYHPSFFIIMASHQHNVACNTCGKLCCNDCCVNEVSSCSKCFGSEKSSSCKGCGCDVNTHSLIGAPHVHCDSCGKECCSDCDASGEMSTCTKLFGEGVKNCKDCGCEIAKHHFAWGTPSPVLFTWHRFERSIYYWWKLSF